MKGRWPAAAFATALLFFSFLVVCPGLYFRGHYFVFDASRGDSACRRICKPKVSYAVFGVALLLSVFTQEDFLFRMTPAEASRSIYGADPFTAALPVARYISEHSGKSAKVAVLGPEPEIYFTRGVIPPLRTSICTG